jgi:hypothetical protein
MVLTKKSFWCFLTSSAIIVCSRKCFKQQIF